ncbi:MAG: DUF3568 domain-containing protein [Deltaproteobacteria bacterium]|nr:DUF3568 domain-containing protein [Deltaproteobacteria bacterium]
MKLSRVVILLALMLVGACGSRMKGRNLMDDIHAYNNGVRWRQYPKAAARVHPDRRAEFVAALSTVEDELKISEWEMVHLEYENKDKNTAKVHIKYSWFLDSVGSVKSTATVQTWKRFGKHWLVTAEKRVRGDEMPGVDEPEDQDEDEIEDPGAEEPSDAEAGKPMKSAGGRSLSLRQMVFEFR